ncbi:MAG: septal ring lytic transglycosylase RlpA family protein [Oxalobacter sp.]|nr:septal ring lytic transglycosylase RlpA family protein [Oxalobacter sp.]
MLDIRRQNSIIVAILAMCCCGLVLSGCSTAPKKGKTRTTKKRKGGGYYLDDGPGTNIPANLDQIPDAEPKVEKIASGPSRPYTVMGTTYTPMSSLSYYRQQGIGSWYGKKFHGLKTASGETYDMFGMTAAHPTLPIPSYAKVTSLENGKQVIVRVNDRGPFLSGRLIDLTYTAAYKLGYVNKGSGRVEVELLLPDEIERIRNGSTTPYTGTASTKPISAFKIGAASKTATGTKTSVSPVTSATVASGWYVQFGAYQSVDNARTHLNRYSSLWSGGYPAIKTVPHGGLYKLMAGPFSTKEAAASARQEMLDRGIDGFVVRK